eukprot:CAMPEP_0195601806 /NCGR_PEP_ID=MMETSP0815-20121206/5274_1 /TAXON_ID=97485 /ORGANISM="Prymnesium parvum, Strain Texoma1" /LENGTH=90 /DNA_ID=CAMNT_0040741357 /DNA_START=178 /DNA_END=447 /DNA_ORIENTATION=-
MPATSETSADVGPYTRSEPLSEVRHPPNPFHRDVADNDGIEGPPILVEARRDARRLDLIEEADAVHARHPHPVRHRGVAQAISDEQRGAA